MNFIRELFVACALFFLIGSLADFLARIVLLQAGKQLPSWVRWVPFADVYFWLMWMK